MEATEPMAKDDVCFHVCEGCGPPGLANDLRDCMPKWNLAGHCVSVRTPTCLSACRFGNVVVVESGDGRIVRYSSVTRNGFHAFDGDPIQVLSRDHVSASADDVPSRGSGEPLPSIPLKSDKRMK